MPSRVLLINVNRCTVPDPVFPLGLAHLNAALRRAGHQARWLDLFCNEDRLLETLEEFLPGLVGISLRNIDDVQIRKRSRFYDDLAPLVTVIRQRSQAPVVLGGSGYSIFPQKLLLLSGASPPEISHFVSNSLTAAGRAESEKLLRSGHFSAAVPKRRHWAHGTSG